MKRWILVLAPSAFALGALSGCVTRDPGPPAELKLARHEYNRAHSGPAAQNNPTGLIEAREALAEAEEKYHEGSDETVDYSYVAKRKAQAAETDARTDVALQNEARKQKAEATRQMVIAAQEKQRAEMSERRARVALDQLGLAAKEDARGTVITIPTTAMFATDKAEILPQARERLAQIAVAVNQVLAERSPRDVGRKLMLVGYTDSTGSDEHNLELSRRRAEAVKVFFAKHGLDKVMLETDGRGEADPIADNETKEGRAENRRVEVVITRPGAMPPGATRP